MRLLVTFSGVDYDRTTQRLVEDGPKFGADRVLVYDDEWLRHHAFFTLPGNKWLWEHHEKRGYGWLAWKPLVILDALELHPLSNVFYVDADCAPVADLSPAFDIAGRDGAMFFTANSHSNHAWVKRDAYMAMAQDERKYKRTQAGCARFCAFSKSGPNNGWKQRQFLYEWLTYSCNPRCNTFDESVLGPEEHGFQQHRCEQAVMTLLAHKYQYKLYRECCEAGNECPDDKELYPQLFTQIHQTHSNNPGTGSKYRNVGW